MENRRLIAYEILNDVLNRKLSLFEVFEEKTKSMKSLEIGFIKELVYGTIRYKKLLDFMFTQTTDKTISNVSTKSKNLVRSGIYQIYFMKKKDYAIVNETVEIAKKVSPKDTKFINWALREFIRNKNKIKIPDTNNKEDLSIKYSFPIHFIEYIIKENGVEYTKSLLEFYNSHSDIHSFNIDTGEIKKLESIDQMTDREYIISPTYANMFRFIANLQVESVLDCCSAPGGKSFLVKHYIKNANILAIDKSKSRLDLMKKNIDKFKLKDIQLMQSDFLQTNIKKVFDLIILDVPCTATGTIRKNPDVKYNYRKKINDLTNIQKEIINKADEYIKEGGYIFYTTCSIFENENYMIIKDFLNNHHDYSLYNQFFTFGNPYSGGYGALLMKNGGNYV